MTAPQTQQRTRQPQSKSPRLWSMLAMFLILRHRDDQELLADRLEVDVARSWRTLDFHDLARTEVAWLDATLDKVSFRHEQSQKLSAALANDLRTLVALENGRPIPAPIRVVHPSDPIREPDLEGPTIVAQSLNERAVARRLMAAGPGAVKHAMPAPEDIAMQKGLSGATGVAVEVAGAGGRSISLQAADVDDELVGYQRVCESDNRVCAFCALLAARGPDYINLARIASTDTKWSLKERDLGKVAEVSALDETPDSSAKAHTHCRCTLIPVFASNRLGVFGWAEVAERIWNNPKDYGWAPSGDWRQDRRAYRKAFDIYKSSHPEAGADGFDRKALREALDDALRDRTDYETTRFLSRVSAGL